MDVLNESSSCIYMYMKYLQNKFIMVCIIDFCRGYVTKLISTFIVLSITLHEQVYKPVFYIPRVCSLSSVIRGTSPFRSVWALIAGFPLDCTLLWPGTMWLRIYTSRTLVRRLRWLVRRQSSSISAEEVVQRLERRGLISESTK